MLTHCSRETPKRVIGKQCRPRSDTAKRGVWSRSPVFANSLAIVLQEYLNWNLPIYSVGGESLFSLQWVKSHELLIFTVQYEYKSIMNSSMFFFLCFWRFFFLLAVLSELVKIYVSRFCRTLRKQAYSNTNVYGKFHFQKLKISR